MKYIDGRAAVDQRCLAVCRECTEQIGRPAVAPFGSTAARDTWLLAHAGGGSHQVRGVDGWPPAAEAYARAFGTRGGAR